jgi:O-antigen/teichoic acid export membrane protein
MSDPNPTTRANRRYLTGFSLAAIAYVAVLFAAIGYVNYAQPHGALRYLLILAPLIPIAFMVPIFIRYFRETDEFQRRIVTESLAIAGGVTALLAVTYAFLESTGLPHPSAWFTWLAVMGSWAIARIFVARRYR